MNKHAWLSAWLGALAWSIVFALSGGGGGFADLGAPILTITGIAFFFTGAGIPSLILGHVLRKHIGSDVILFLIGFVFSALTFGFI